MKVNIADEYPYVVVQFLELPYTDIDDYVCVPRSWVRMRRATDRKIMVAYPDEPPSMIRMRIINCDEASEKWKLYMAIIKDDTYYKLGPATTKNRYSPLLKTTKLLDFYSKWNKNKLKVVKKAGFDDTISYLNKSPEYFNVESRALISSEQLGHTSSEDIVMKKIEGIENQEQNADNVLPSYDDLLLEKLNFRQKDIAHNIALTKIIENKNIPNIRNLTADFPKPLIQDPDIGSSISFVIQNSTNNADQNSKVEVSKSSLIDQDYLQVPATQETLEQSSEVEGVITKPSCPSRIKSPSYASGTYSNLAEHQDSTIEEMAVDELSEASCIEQNAFSRRQAESKSSGNPNSPKNENRYSQSVENFMEEGSPMFEVVTSSDASSTQDIDNNERSYSPETSLEEIYIFDPNFDEQVNQSVDSILNKVDIEPDQLFSFFKNIEVKFLQSCETARALHKSLVQSHKVIECLTNASNKYRELKEGKVTVETSKEVPVEVQQMPEENQAEKKVEEITDVNMEEEKKENNDVNKDVKCQIRSSEAPKTTRGHIRTFVLPPEYDPDDTRWTLKYRENDPELNLVELVPQSNVFINSIKLAHCKRVAKDSKALARMLLVEIFTQSALSVCSLTGVRANAFNISGTNVRPGLDENARITILSFVEEHAYKQKLGPFDTQSVINSLRSKIQEVRAKHGKTA